MRQQHNSRVLRFEGIVQPGRGYGRRLGFPTLNIPCDTESLSGIFAGRVRLASRWYQAAVYADSRRHLLEAHILEVLPAEYEKTITIELLKKIREDARFETEETLKQAILKDIEKITTYFAL